MPLHSRADSANNGSHSRQGSRGDGQIVVRPIMAIGVTFDHRLVDGVHAAHMHREFKKYFADPETYLS